MSFPEKDSPLTAYWATSIARSGSTEARLLLLNRESQSKVRGDSLVLLCSGRVENSNKNGVCIADASREPIHSTGRQVLPKPRYRGKVSINPDIQLGWSWAHRNKHLWLESRANRKTCASSTHTHAGSNQTSTYYIYYKRLAIGHDIHRNRFS